jgi:hypothetical protein
MAPYSRSVFFGKGTNAVDFKLAFSEEVGTPKMGQDFV